MTGVLVTGATGKTGTALVETLRAHGVPVRAGSRSASAQDPDAVRFDWHAPAHPPARGGGGLRDGQPLFVRLGRHAGVLDISDPRHLRPLLTANSD